MSDEPRAQTGARPRRAAAARIARGDWQTPDALAASVVAVLADQGLVPSAVLEPTCGQGAFLAAAAHRWPGVPLWGVDVHAPYVHAAAQRLGTRATVVCADFFAEDWQDWAAKLPDRTLLLGNPPWVTSADLGVVGSANRPRREVQAGTTGLAAKTGASNFDVSEAVLRQLVLAWLGRPFCLAMLCKASVARRLLAYAHAASWPVTGEVRSFCARTAFRASVDAVLLVLRGQTQPPAAHRWQVFPALHAPASVRTLGVVSGHVCPDVDGVADTAWLEGKGPIPWRSGVKHDCAPVMELLPRGDGWANGLDEPVALEDTWLFPYLKGADLAAGRAPFRRVLVPQHTLGAPTEPLQESAPRTYSYLVQHRARLDGRRSSIYRNQPPFSVFGLGTYTFAPWKVAIAALHKTVAFRVVGPVGARPVLLDDTCYFIPFADEANARVAAACLNAPEAQRFFEARRFVDDKRSITQKLLQRIRWDYLKTKL